MEKFNKAIREYIYWKAMNAHPRILYNEKYRAYLVALIVPFDISKTDWRIIHG